MSSGNKEKDPCDWILFYDSKDTTEDVLGRDCSDYCQTSKSSTSVRVHMPDSTAGNTSTSSGAPSRRMQMRKTVNIFFDPPLCEIDSTEGGETGESGESGQSGGRRRKRFRYKHGPDERGAVVTALLAGLQQYQDSMLQAAGPSVGVSGASTDTSRSGSAAFVSAETGSIGSIGVGGSSPSKRNRPSPDTRMKSPSVAKFRKVTDDDRSRSGASQARGPKKLPFSEL